MSLMQKKPLILSSFVLFCLLVTGLAFSGPGSEGQNIEPPKVPALWTLDGPKSVAAGETLKLSLQLEPKKGIKINQYPQISWTIKSKENPITKDVTAKLGLKSFDPNASEEDRYFKKIDPISLEITIPKNAPSGNHVMKSKLKYFYCVTASGFCAPARADVEIPITIR